MTMIMLYDNNIWLDKYLLEWAIIANVNYVDSKHNATNSMKSSCVFRGFQKSYVHPFNYFTYHFTLNSIISWVDIKRRFVSTLHKSADDILSNIYGILVSIMLYTIRIGTNLIFSDDAMPFCYFHYSSHQWSDSECPFDWFQNKLE